MRSDFEKTERVLISPLSSVVDAIDSVPWDRIHAYMVLTKWHWGRNTTPSVADLHACVNSLVAEVLRSDKDATECSTGGFVVSNHTYDSGTDFRIRFCIR